MFEAIQDSGVTQWLNMWLWGFPAAEIFHIIMTGTFFGGIMMLDLRLLGLNRFISSIQLMRHVLTCIWVAFAGVVVSGILLFLFMPLEYPGNPVFQLKLVVILFGAVNAFWMHRFLLNNMSTWDIDQPPPPGVRLSAILSMGTWMTALACGRLIAYFYY